MPRQRATVVISCVTCSTLMEFDLVVGRAMSGQSCSGCGVTISCVLTPSDDPQLQSFTNVCDTRDGESAVDGYADELPLTFAFTTT